MPATATPIPGEPLGPDSLQRYEPFVRRILRHMLQGEDEVNDLVQETWVRVLQHPPKDPHQAKGWLATVARNLARDYRRRQKSRLAREEFVARRESETQVEASGARLQLHQSLVQAVIDLPDPYKPVVLLHYFEGLSLKAIAERLDRPQGTVRSQLHRAHGMLKNGLDQRYGQRQSWVLVGLPWVVGREGLHALQPSAPFLGTGWLMTLVTLVLSLGGLGWWWMQSEAHDASPLEQGFSMAEPAAGLPEFSAFTKSMGQREPVQRKARAQGVPDGSPRDPIASIEVQVRLHGQPVPHAEVWAWRPLLRTERGFASGAAWQDLNRLRHWPASLWDWSRDQSQIRRTDHRGRVRLDVHATGAALMAQAPGATGVLSLQSLPPLIDGPIDFALTPDHGVRVRIVDSWGQPATGVDVELWSEAPDGTQRLAHVLPAQGPLAEAHFMGFRSLRPESRRFLVRVGCAGHDTPSTPVPTADRREPILLQTPAFGRLSWSLPEVIGDDPLAEPRSLWLQALDHDGQPDGDPIWRPAQSHRGTWPCVALDRTWHVRLETVGSGELCEWQGPGPTSDQPQQHADLRPVAVYRVEGRLVSTTPTPLRRFAMDFDLLDTNNQTVQTVRFLPGQDGSFSLALPLVNSHPSELRAEIVGRWSLQGDQRIRVRLPNKAWNIPGTIRLGEVAAALVPASLDGILLDAQGHPVPGVRIEARGHRAGETLVSTSDEQGKFVLFGLLPDAVEARIPIGQAWFAPPRVFSTETDTPETWTVTPTGRVEGSVPLPLADRPDLWLTSVGSGLDLRVPVTWDLTGERFFGEGLPAGTWRLQSGSRADGPVQHMQVWPGRTSDAGLWPSQQDHGH